MDDPTFTIGRVQVTAITDGAEDIGPITESFPAIPAEDLLSDRDRFPGLYGADDAWHIFIRVWLIRHPGGLLLMDTGVGHADWFPATGRLPEALAAAGVAPTDVDTVVISHTHDDHIGGNVTPQGTPAFPNARYMIQFADVATERAWAQEAEENREMWDQLLQPLIDADVLDQVDGDHVLTDLLRLQHAPGHTPGHQILHAEDAGARLVLTADTWNHPGQFAHPEWPSGADADHDLAAATRRSLLATLTADPPATLAPTHLAEAFGTVITGPDGVPEWTPHRA
jgi:glyoxylase-like metal-dependent hydrolase (beta-lactamase superfamily II)